MNRTVDRKFQLLFKDSSEFLEAGRTAYYVNSRNIISCEEFLCDGCHFFDSCLDHRENLFFFLRIGLENLCFFVWDSIMSCYSHGHMAASGSLIVSINYFTVFQDADTGSTATYVYNSSVCDLQYSSGSGRLIYNVGYFKSGTFQYIADAFDTAFRYSGRNGSSSVKKFCAKFFFQFCFQSGNQLDRFIIIYNNTVLNSMGRGRNACYGTVVGIYNSQDSIGSSKVHTYFQPSAEFFAFTGLHKAGKV